MGSSLRQCAAWLHTWSGLVVGWLLFFVFVTGTAGYFQLEITRWMQPEHAPVTTHSSALPDASAMAALAVAQLQQKAPEALSWNITLPHHGAGDRNWQTFMIRWQPASGTGGSERLDPLTGNVLPPQIQARATEGGAGLYRMHYALHYMPGLWAIRIVGACSMLMLIAVVTGVITHKKIFQDFFVFRPGKGQRSWLDAHNAVSVMALPFFLMITYSGLLFFMYLYMPAGRDVLYGSSPAEHKAFFAELRGEAERKRLPIAMPTAPLAPMLARAITSWGDGQLASITIEHREGTPPTVVLRRREGGSLDIFNAPTLRFHSDTGALLPGEVRGGAGAVLTAEVTLNLHEGLFADIWGRWLYFIAGLLGCATIATGLVLWTVKRRRCHLGAGREAAEAFGLRLVENLNVATIAGLPLAMAAYFWANRLLPVGMADRAAWEFHSLFVAWLATLFYALSRPLARAWIELLWACGLAYALVPAINLLTTDRHLGRSLPAGDWVFAGFDLTMLALAALFAVMAARVHRRLGAGG